MRTKVTHVNYTVNRLNEPNRKSTKSLPKFAHLQRKKKSSKNTIKKITLDAWLCILAFVLGSIWAMTKLLEGLQDV